MNAMGENGACFNERQLGRKRHINACPTLYAACAVEWAPRARWKCAVLCGVGCPGVAMGWEFEYSCPFETPHVAQFTRRHENALDE
mmetsp:Transcript_28884/g.65453  ORF Transcript_28884/g.65453 Transcript_28884/m.65453 type:complete len:86 (+) Transcript_28884:903-1160(+)